MPLLGLGSQMNNNIAVPSSYYFNLATWHTINLVYTQKVSREIQEVHRDARERDKLARLMKLVEQRDGHWLALKMEEAKITLSDNDNVSLDLDRIALAQPLQVQRDQFDAAVTPLVSSIEETVLRLLADAQVAASAVDTVFFTGGSSGVQLLRQKIAALLPGARRVDGDLFGSIGMGLGLDAQRKFG